MSEIKYPALVTSYSVSFSEDKVQLQLSGFEEPLREAKENPAFAVNLARIDFVPVQKNESPSFNSFTNRGGFLQATRPLWLLSSILVLLEQGGVIQIDGNGNLTKTAKIAEVAN